MLSGTDYNKWWRRFAFLWVVYIIDHEVIPRSCKSCDWMLNSSWDCFSLHQEKNVIMNIEFEVPKSQLLGPTLSIDMVQRVLQWERQKRCSSRKDRGPWQISAGIIKI